MSRDIFTRLHDIDQDTMAFLAQMLERRGQHPQQAAIRKAYLDALGDISDLNVYEVGCGTGVVTRDLARRVGPRGKLLASDPTPALVEVARERATSEGLPELDLQVHDARQIPLEDGQFDVTCAVTVLSHVPEREQVLGEMVRVTRPGGRILIVDGDFASIQLEHTDRALTNRIVEAWRAETVDDPYLTRRLASMVTRAGLTIQSLQGHVHVEAGRVDPESSFILPWMQFAARQALAAGTVSSDEAAGWVADFQQMNERHQLFGSYAYVSVICQRP